MKWIVAVIYCVLIASFANIASCHHDEFILHVGAQAYETDETIP